MASAALAGDLDSSQSLSVADARSLEASDVIEIHYEVVREELTADPALLWGVVVLLAERLRSVNSGSARRS